MGHRALFNFLKKLKFKSWQKLNVIKIYAILVFILDDYAMLIWIKEI